MRGIAKYSINGVNSSVQLGDITEANVDAVIVPQFTSGASYGGVGGAVMRSGAESGMRAYDDYISEQGEQAFGTVLLTPSGSPKAPYLLHVVSVGSGAEDEFNTIKTATYNALSVAGDNGIKSIALPALGTGIIGRLTNTQSAEAMMSAVAEYHAAGGHPVETNFVIYGDHNAYQAFVEVLKGESYKSSNESQTGQREIDPARWVTGMARDANANQKHYQNKPIIK